MNGLCIHGHFYQPPREDPWLDSVPPEGSAAPMDNWNLRIARESYAPLAWARRLDGEGRITDVVNCYEWISFNFGPTLLRWLRREDPATHRRIQEADRLSAERWGHGNAMAQVCHHAILPLCTPRDRELEVAWGIDDFQTHFGRRPSGMWLAEAAVDTASLETLAAHGIEFVLLAPRQAESVAPVDSDDWTDVGEEGPDITRPYTVELPSGRDISVSFYDGPLSQAVAFERLLESGDAFWDRLSANPAPGLRAVGTDGETYGHHFPFGEMALAYVLERARADDSPWRLTNFAAYLETNPPTMRCRLREPSSWSCVHGVERWRADCGCTTGGHPDFNQSWRKPLREALDLNKLRVDRHFFRRGEACFADPKRALREYGKVEAGALSQSDFEKAQFQPGLDASGKESAWKLLAMQRWALSSFASCAWFFDELTRLEPLAALTHALRSLELARHTGSFDWEEELVMILGQARSNYPGEGSGADVWRNHIVPRRLEGASLAAFGLLILAASDDLPVPGGSASLAWPGLRLTFRVTREDEDGALHGSMEGAVLPGAASPPVNWTMTQPPDGDPLQTEIVLADGQRARTGDLSWNRLEEAAMRLTERAAEAAWRTRLACATRATALYLPYQEAQTSPIHSWDWAELAPALAWRACTVDGADHQELWDFLVDRLRDHPVAESLSHRLAKEAARLATEENDPAGAARVLHRARRLGLSPDPWRAQNAAWERRGAMRIHGEAAARLGFAPDALG
ncbi:DUF3536 domain-containing protein [Desulfohalovibrio reitneri]|uniref:DUF3536 domain-containing protein n=1 Tax=Desulfohalovibrio reitneri TaxID=1307759 RepID=UPI0004A72202|nr:DUF3536 domain-containing protein [Desulfohalovibrio reitneri]